jgi:hypothetical protein
VLGQFFDVLEKTIASGKSDGGGALLLLPKSVSFVAGGYVADGPAMEKVLTGLIDLGKDQPNFPQIQLNAGAHGDVKLHRLTAPLPADREPEARELLGDPLEIFFGIGPKSFYISGGKGAEALLKKAIDRSAAAGEKSVPPMQMNVSLLPILKFYKSVDDNPIVNGLIPALEQAGNDRLTIVSKAGQRSATTRIEIQEGIIQAIGQVAKALGAGAQGGF